MDRLAKNVCSHPLDKIQNMNVDQILGMYHGDLKCFFAIDNLLLYCYIKIRIAGSGVGSDFLILKKLSKS